MIFHLLGEILIAGGEETLREWTPEKPRSLLSPEFMRSAYILQVQITSNQICKVRYFEIDEMPEENIRAFYQNCQGRIIIGSGRNDNVGYVRSVFELDSIGWKSLAPLNIPRVDAASTYINNTLIVSGGVDKYADLLSSLEILEISSDTQSTQWEICQTFLPNEICGHTLTGFKGEIYLIGGLSSGCDEDDYSGKHVWKGMLMPKKGPLQPKYFNRFPFSKQSISFKRIASMQQNRDMHFSIVVNDQIHVFGGESEGKNSFVEIFDGETWSIGPDFPLLLSHDNANAVLTRQNVIIITTIDNGIGIYDPIQGTVNFYEHFKVKDGRSKYAAMLIDT